MLPTSGDKYNTAATAPERVREGGEVGNGGGGVSNLSEDEKNILNRVVDEGERMNYGANRWPRQETLALLKIRSDMDRMFRDSTPKGPLWEEVSRKLAELGYHRSAKKCREKFENVYKYHKRTKEGRTGKAEGKIYKFFDHLQALDRPPPKPPVPPQVAATVTAPLPWNINHPPPTVPSMPNPIKAMPLHLFSSSTSSSTASDEEQVKGSRKRKRKWKNFFHRLTKNVIKKQEELQRKFLETVEKYENERILREESWRMQQMERIIREHEILIQEHSSAAAEDAAVIQVLQKISRRQQVSLPDRNINVSLTPPPPTPVQPQLPPQPAKPPQPPPAIVPAVANLDFSKRDNGDSNAPNGSSSRWPKAEIEALINLRTSLDIKYQDNGAKGPLWEEISTGMTNLGYNRNAKRCKEKWENINKYFKKVKESNKKRSEDSKTCPYFSQLDALYKKKNKNLNSAGYAATPVMVRSEQQWPAKENQNFEDEDDDDDEDTETEDDDDDDGVGFEVVASKPPEASSLGANGE